MLGSVLLGCAQAPTEKPQVKPEPAPATLGALPATYVDDPARKIDRHLRCEITRRPRALVLEFQILGGGPVSHLNSSYRLENSPPRFVPYRVSLL